MSHTPGPWSVYEKDKCIVVFGDGESICDTAPGNPYISFEQAEANARLIAAAPDMLAELRRLHEKCGWQSTADLLARVMGSQRT